VNYERKKKGSFYETPCACVIALETDDVRRQTDDTSYQTLDLNSRPI